MKPESAREDSAFPNARQQRPPAIRSAAQDESDSAGARDARQAGSDSAEWMAEIRVMLKTSVNDPQGLSIRNALRTLGFGGVADVRAGKLIQVQLTAKDRQAAEAAVEQMGSQLLANPVIETFSFTLDALPAHVA